MVMALIQAGQGEEPLIYVWVAPTGARGKERSAPALDEATLEAVGPAPVIVSLGAYGTESLPDALAFARERSRKPRARLGAVLAFSAGCRVARAWWVAGDRAPAYVLLDGVAASKPPEAWQVEWVTHLCADARARRRALALSHGYLDPPDYTGTAVVARLATGWDLPPLSTGEVAVTVEGALRVYSRGGASEGDHRAHVAELLHRGVWEVARPFLEDDAPPGPPSTPDVHVEGLGAMPLEAYVARVVSAEVPASWHPEALRFQAVLARTYALAAMRDDPRLGTRGRPLPRGEGFQAAASTPTEAARRASSASQGVVLAHDGGLITAYYVAGAPATMGASGPSPHPDPKADPRDTERLVTYNAGRRGGAVHPRPEVRRVPGNRGCASQRGAEVAARTGWDALRIARYYYGEDVELVTREREGRDRAQLEELRWTLGMEEVRALPLPLGERCLSVCLAELRAGVAESPPGSNAGPRVRQYLAPCRRRGTEAPLGLSSGDWCAAAQSFAAWSAARPGERIPHGYRAAVAELRADAADAGAWIEIAAARERPAAIRVGDLAVYDRGGGRGHVARVSKPIRDESFEAIGGNEEDGWRARTRPLGDPKLVGFIAYPR